MQTTRLTILAAAFALAAVAGPTPGLLAQSIDLDLALAALADDDASEIGFTVTAKDASTGEALTGETVAIGLDDPSAADAPDQVLLGADGRADFSLTGGDIEACRSIVVKAVLQQAEDEVTTEICPAEGGELVFGEEADAQEFEPGLSFDRNARGEVASLAVRPEVVPPGETARGRVELEGMELTADDVEPVTVALESDDPAAASVPAEVSTDRTYASFAIETGTVADERTVTITASNRGTSATATLIVRPLAIAGLVVDPSTLRYRDRGKLAVRLNGPAPRTTTITLSSSRPDLLDVPEEIEIAAGRREARAEVTATRRVRRQVRVVVTATLRTGKATAGTMDEVVLVAP